MVTYPMSLASCTLANLTSSTWYTYPEVLSLANLAVTTWYTYPELLAYSTLERVLLTLPLSVQGQHSQTHHDQSQNTTVLVARC